MLKETRLYDILGIPQDSTMSQIKKGYRASALKYHPDKNKEDKDATEKFKEITRAYEVLSDERKRSTYDQYGEAGLNGEIQPEVYTGSEKEETMFMNPDDLFSQMFGDAFGGSFFTSGSSSRYQQQKRRGRDINYHLKCSLESLYTGKVAKLLLSKQIKCKLCDGYGANRSNIRKCVQCNGRGVEILHKDNGYIKQTLQRTCTRCNGSGQHISARDVCQQCQGQKYYQSKEVISIDVPPGTRDDESIFLRGMADEGPNIRPGDVIITVKQQPHPTFQRRNNDLLYTAEIPLVTALTGGLIQIEFFGEKSLNVKIDQGEIISPEDSKIIKGYGMPYHLRDGSKKFGNLIVNFKIVFPKREELTEQSFATLKSILPAAAPINRKRTHDSLERDSDDSDCEVEQVVDNVVFEKEDDYYNKAKKMKGNGVFPQ